MSDELPETPSMARVLLDAIDGKITELHVALPGRIEKYDKTTQMADVQPLLQRRFKDDTLVDLPVITNVPVMFPRTATAIISMPIAAGDTGLIIFCERSIDTWTLKGGICDPNDTRKHDLSDGIFIPGLYPFTQPSLAEDDVVLVRNALASLRVKKDGKFEMKNLAGNDFVAIMLDFINAVISAKAIDPLSGPLALDPATLMLLNAMKVKMMTLTG